MSTPQAEALYKERCANCHDRGVPRAANREALGRLSPDAIRQALTTGAMRTQAEGLSALNPKAGGGLFALNPENGNIVWSTPHPGCGERPGCSPAQSAAVTAIPGVVLSGGLDGHLRAYASHTGKIIWDVDTAQPYKTVNAVQANGGSLDGPGPVVVGGMLFVNSGYAFIGGVPGNVLLAYSIDGRQKRSTSNDVAHSASSRDQAPQIVEPVDDNADLRGRLFWFGRLNHTKSPAIVGSFRTEKRP